MSVEMSTERECTHHGQNERNARNWDGVEGFLVEYTKRIAVVKPYKGDNLHDYWVLAFRL